MKALAVATGFVFWTLVIGIAVLALFPGSDVGEPVAILQIEPAAASTPAAPGCWRHARRQHRSSVEEGHEPARQRHLQPKPKANCRPSSRLRRTRA